MEDTSSSKSIWSNYSLYLSIHVQGFMSAIREVFITEKYLPSLDFCVINVL